jgi:murein hydrolase activator
MKRSILLLLLILTVATTASAQRRSTLETKRKKLLADIQTTTNKLNQTKEIKAETGDQLETLLEQMETRENLVNNLYDETEELDAIIEETSADIEDLETEYTQLKKDYAFMLRKAYKLRMNKNSFMFVLAADNAKNAFKRLQYFRQYNRYRTKQAKRIKEMQNRLKSKIALLSVSKTQKSEVIKTTEAQQNKLQQEKQEKDVLLNSLASKEKQLTTTLQKQALANAKLDKQIQNFIIEEENAKKRAAEAYAKAKLKKASAERETKRSKRKRKKSNSTESEQQPTTSEPQIITATPENLALSSDFRSNKGKLSLPVNKGVIVKSFGRQAHESVENVEIINNGIDIRTDANADVHVVFNGTVTIAQYIAGFNNVVIVQHGNYYTVYSNVESPSVKKGDTVQTGQSIAKVATGATLHFEIWQERNQVNPANWLNR